MSDLAEKIRHLIEDVPRDEGIKGFIKLQSEVPQNMKYKCRFACLHLMQMNHDWEGIRKFLIQWKLVRSFGKDLVLRMRKRVGEELGTASDDIDLITKQLDRLNEKNWRQFSPKKSFPQYTKLLAQVSNKQSKPSDPVLIPQAKKQEKDRNQKQEKAPLAEGGSIFARLSQFQKTQKNRESGAKGIFSKQLQRSDSSENQKLQKKQKAAKSNILPNENRDTTIQKVELKKKIEGQNPLIKKIEPTKPTTPSKEGQKKIISVKYGNSRETISEDSKDEFSFSAVKAKQIQGMSHKKPTKANEQLDNSFFNFTNESRIKEKQEHLSEKKNILEEMKFEDEFMRVNPRHPANKPLFCEQELGLIDIQNPPKNHIRNILNAEGMSPLQMLKSRLLAL